MLPGASIAEVIQLKGKPIEKKVQKADGVEIWIYPHELLAISLDTKRVTGIYKFDPYRQQKSKAKQIAYHKNLEDATLLFDKDKTFANVFMINTNKNGKLYGFIENGIVYYYNEDLTPLNLLSYFTAEKKIKFHKNKNTPSGDIVQDISKQMSKLTELDLDFPSDSLDGDSQQITFYDILCDSGESLYDSTIQFDSLPFYDYYTSTGSVITQNTSQVGNITFYNYHGPSGYASGSSMDIGDTTFHNFHGSDGYVSGTSMDIGDMTFHNFQGSGDYLSGTSMNMGDMTFHNFHGSDGYVSGTSMDMGGMTFHNFQGTDGYVSGSSMNMGDMTFHNFHGSDGDLSGSSIRVGDMTFHNYYDSSGNYYGGSTMDMGSSSYTNIYGW